MARRVWIFRNVRLTQAMPAEKKMTGSHQGLFRIAMRDGRDGLFRQSGWQNRITKDTGKTRQTR
jgi:hypothetical protein